MHLGKEISHNGNFLIDNENLGEYTQIEGESMRRRLERRGGDLPTYALGKGDLLQEIREKVRSEKEIGQRERRGLICPGMHLGREICWLKKRRLGR